MEQRHLVNHYFDTSDRALQSAGAMLRVRQIVEGPALICFKRARSSSHGDFEAEEHEEILDPRDWKRIRARARIDDVSHPVVRLVRRLLGDGDLRRLGATYVRRRSYDAAPGAILELDETTFEDGGRDWELELEAGEPGRFRQDLRDLLDRHEIAWTPQRHTKYERFLTHVRPDHERLSRRLLDRADILAVWVFLTLAALAAAVTWAERPLVELGFASMTWPEAIATGMVFANFVLIVASRRADEWYHLGGVRSLYRERSAGYLRRVGWPAAPSPPAQHDLERTAGGAITKLSIMSAIAAGLVAILLQGPTSLTPLPLRGDEFLRLFAVSGLSIAIVFMLIAILCYDYAERFTWPASLKLELHRKGFRYDVWSWYSLMTFFVVALASVHPVLSIGVNGIYGVLLWNFYYFNREALATHVASTWGL